MRAATQSSLRSRISAAVHQGRKDGYHSACSIRSNMASAE